MQDSKGGQLLRVASCGSSSHKFRLSLHPQPYLVGASSLSRCGRYWQFSQLHAPKAAQWLDCQGTLPRVTILRRSRYSEEVASLALLQGLARNQLIIVLELNLPAVMIVTAPSQVRGGHFCHPVAVASEIRLYLHPSLWGARRLSRALPCGEWPLPYRVGRRLGRSR